MDALDKRYWCCFRHYKEYTKQFMLKDIQDWEAIHNFYFYFKPDDIADIKSELKCLLFADIKKKYDKNLEIYNYKNYVITVCKYDIMDILGKR